MTSPEATQGEWLKLGDAAFALGVSEITLRRKIKSGRIPFELRDGKYFVQIDGDEQTPSKPSTSSKMSEKVSTTLSHTRAFHDTIKQPSKSTNSQNEKFSQSLASTTMELAHLQARIAELEYLLEQKTEAMLSLERKFEDQQTLIAFLEDSLKELKAN